MPVKVTLRQKPISKGRTSLFLDYYPPITHPETGEPTRREFLGMYVLDKPKNPQEKMHNSETLKIAEGIRQRKENILNKPEIYTAYEQEQLRNKELGELCFVEYFSKLADKRKASNHDNWLSARNYLIAFTNGKLKFADLNEKFLNDFKDYLLTTQSIKSAKTTLAQNSAVSYFNKVKATMKQAYKDGILQFDLNERVEPIKRAETRRNYLTLEELNRLAKTPCNNPLLKRVALFSALTGLRFSDIKNLVWGQVQDSREGGKVLLFTQQKTQGVEDLPISEQAYEMMGEPGKKTDKIFPGLNYSGYENKHLYQWIGASGITKDITFHCFRHTYATLQISMGTDIYTVSKLLGHRDLKTTQIYAKIVDKLKQDATHKIKLEI
jgi:integrase